MRFRPCIDIHNGKVKQIVGGSLRDAGDRARENFVSGQDAGFYANLYREKDLPEGHIILLNSQDSPYYEATRQQALKALKAYPKGLQVGGGISPDNAGQWLEAGASKVIVTSYVFKEGQINYERLEELERKVGRQQLVLDLSCRKKEGQYYIVTDRWQKYTDVVLEEKTLELFSAYADEFLIHAVDVEGKAEGIEEEVVKLLGDWGKIPMTYAGGIHSYEDLDRLKCFGRGRVDFTVGSALDLFGGSLKFEEIAGYKKSHHISESEM